MIPSVRFGAGLFINGFPTQECNKEIGNIIIEARKSLDGKPDWRAGYEDAYLGYLVATEEEGRLLSSMKAAMEKIKQAAAGLRNPDLPQFVAVRDDKCLLARHAKPWPKPSAGRLMSTRPRPPTQSFGLRTPTWPMR